jgi:hypothetical protein
VGLLHKEAPSLSVSAAIRHKTNHSTLFIGRDHSYEDHNTVSHTHKKRKKEQPMAGYILLKMLLNCEEMHLDHATSSFS